MDRAAKFCFLSFVLLALMTSQAAGANTQGLYWGLKVGDRLDYVFVAHSNITYSAASLNERVYIIVNGMPMLPDIVTMASEAMSYNTTAYWANGSLMAFGGMTGPSLLMFVAIGNWPLLKNLMFVDLPPEYEMVDDSSLWGIRGGISLGNAQANMSFLFSKSDGGTYRYYVDVHDLATGDEILHNEFSRVTQGISTTVLVSVSIISGEIIVAALLIKRYRH